MKWRNIAQILEVQRWYLCIVKGHDNIGLTESAFDEDVKPFTPLAANPIRTSDFLHYVASRQNAMDKYKEEFQVGSYLWLRSKLW